MKLVASLAPEKNWQSKQTKKTLHTIFPLSYSLPYLFWSNFLFFIYLLNCKLPESSVYIDHHSVCSKYNNVWILFILNISWAYVYIYTEAQIWNRIGPKTTLSLSVGIWEGEKEKRGEVKRNSSSKNHKIPFQAERKNCVYVCKRMNESVGPCVLCCGSSEVAVWTTSVSKSLKEKGVSWHC